MRRLALPLRLAVLSALSLGSLTTTAGTASASLPSGDDRGCINYGNVKDAPGKFISRDDMVAAKRDPLAKWVSKNQAEVNAALRADGTITVPVAFHVIRKDETLSGGNIPRTQIVRQMRVLNNAFDTSGFRFDLVETTRTTSPQWFNLIPTEGDDRRYFRGSSKEIKMEQALASRDSETLDIYTSALGKFLLGWAYLPADFVGDNPLPRFYDGVVVDYRSLPGGRLHRVQRW